MPPRVKESTVFNLQNFYTKEFYYTFHKQFRSKSQIYPHKPSPAKISFYPQELKGRWILAIFFLRSERATLKAKRKQNSESWIYCGQLRANRILFIFSVDGNKKWIFWKSFENIDFYWNVLLELLE